MSLYEINDTRRCKNCHQEFADHNYVADSIDEYACPYPRTETGYGYFNGGDPRTFHPDYECCTGEEIARWKAACDLWDEKSADGKPPDPEKCPSGWIHDEQGNRVVHVLRAPYGIGTYTMEFETIFEPIEYDDSDDYDELLF